MLIATMFHASMLGGWGAAVAVLGLLVGLFFIFGVTTSADLNYPGLYDIIKRMDPDGSIAPIVESLSKFSPVLQDVMWKEGNLPTGHRFTSRTALPSVGWRRFNEGVAPSKSKTDQVDEPVGMCDGWSIVDSEEAELNGNEAAFRLSEEMGYIQAFANEMETGVFYHSTATAPEKFNGLSPRYSATTNAGSGKQIIKADPTGNANVQSSVWLLGWGPET